MSYYTSLTGLNAAATDLSVTANNIANVGTTGFKKSSAQFGEIVASSALEQGGAGLGTSLRSIDQQFTQGAFQTTDRRGIGWSIVMVPVTLRGWFSVVGV